ncbi:MAG: glycoside hydrolase family 3 C-terminal domain-containing protein [Bacteroidales bacterium]|nr:glycoside hydrolase family 3 C-terminal domain-containing protein [Bacteroidales bacterium]
MERIAKTIKVLIVIVSLCVVGVANGQSQSFSHRDTVIEAKVERLLRQLTLDEKLSLMQHRNPAIERVGLPEYSWWNEALHGVGRAGIATVYPMPIALAATFNPDMVRDVFSSVAAEARRKHLEAQDTGYRGDYSGLTFFTPNINIFRDPRWGRGMETYGEDPYLTAVMGLACVNGLQHSTRFANNLPLTAAACLKHFAVHSGPEGTRHEFDSRVGESDFYSTYLPAFEYIIKNSDVQQVMCGYNRLNGEPCCTNRRLFDLLRQQWHYDGLIVTDCWALNDTYERDTVIPRHRTHPSAALAYGDAFGSEVDLECGSGLPALRQAVRYGYVPESKIDEHVRRILRVRMALEAPTGFDDKVIVTSPVDVAAQSMVLLKNTGILPLKLGQLLRLEGPNLNDSLMPLGNYNGNPRHTVTIGEALADFAGQGGTTAIYVGGLSPQLEGEELPVEQDGFYRGDRTRIELPANQVADIKALKADGYNVVLVLCTGSAIALEEVVDLCDAVIVSWYGGEAMGTAVKQLLYGERDDFGRLPVTFYRGTDQLPDFDDYAMQRRTYRYADREQVLFQFGFGYSYSFYQLWGPPKFDADSLVLSGLVSQCATDAPLSPQHRTVVQAYVVGTGPDAPVKQLVGTASVMTTCFEEKIPFRIEIDPFWLRQYNPATGRMEEPADGTPLTLQVGFSSDDRDLQDIHFIYHTRKH